MKALASFSGRTYNDDDYYDSEDEDEEVQKEKEGEKKEEKTAEANPVFIDGLEYTFYYDPNSGETWHYHKKVSKIDGFSAEFTKFRKRMWRRYHKETVNRRRKDARKKEQEEIVKAKKDSEELELLKKKFAQQSRAIKKLEETVKSFQEDQRNSRRVMLSSPDVQRMVREEGSAVSGFNSEYRQIYEQAYVSPTPPTGEPTVSPLLGEAEPSIPQSLGVQPIIHTIESSSCKGLCDYLEQAAKAVPTLDRLAAKCYWYYFYIAANGRKMRPAGIIRTLKNTMESIFAEIKDKLPQPSYPDYYTSNGSCHLMFTLKKYGIQNDEQVEYSRIVSELTTLNAELNKFLFSTDKSGRKELEEKISKLTARRKKLDEGLAKRIKRL